MSSKQSRVLSLFSRYDAIPAAAIPADLSLAGDVAPSWPLIFGRLKQGEHFSVFMQDHQEECAAVYNYLLSLDSFDKYEKECKRLMGLLNEGLYLHAVSVALLHRKDADGALLPPMWQINPTSFFPGPVIKQARNLARVIQTNIAKIGPAEPFITGTHNDPEFKVAWFREDCDLNMHHMHWHMAYPVPGVDGKTKDRQGELFYYMHNQMLARYDAERIAAGLHRVEPYLNWDQPIPEGYNSQLTDYYGSNQYAPRPSGLRLADWYNSSRPTLVVEQTYHFHRLLDAINSGKFVMPDTTLMDVDIVSLGAAVEATVGSPNSAIYGSVHNNGHNLLANITDPDGRYKQAPGVMGDEATAIRDPIFFRWHKFIDNLFVLHKTNLVPYDREELKFGGITVDSIKVKVSSPSTGRNAESNVLTTRMEKTKIDIQHDMFLRQDDQKPNTPVYVTVNQLNHDEFMYEIAITAKQEVKAAAVRIFMAPSFDEADELFELEKQRRLFIEMDKFVVKLNLGPNTISRSSTRSSVIKPPDMTFKQLEDAKDATKGKCRSDRYCECGWPLRMLLPRGTRFGMTFDFFVMVTDWASDSTDKLDEGSSYCGVKNKKYPDSRAMGFPFDRKITGHETVQQFADEYSNMDATPITIKYLA